ncbi:helicase associated domain-containing protein [Streptomyces virginiae]|uniref:helicase associated domain-containing protein n=1 Tax=Streptomyces virginiae TaxID=1961 RepID=UPI00224FFC40|nr:helicase associated domain-containing protein [Streptomyces virginiae]MCX5174056.1 helicase associated domain-containing protein [Streptomyces virginiae]
MEQALRSGGCPEFWNSRSRPGPNALSAPEEGEEESRLLLRFAAPRDPALIAKWISYQVINTERQDWRRGAEAALRYRQREGDLEVPYEHVETAGAFPLGRWLSDQRRAYRAGTMTGERAAELEELGIVWDTADAGFEQNLGAARAYYELHGTLAAPRGATILDIAIGQYLTNIRRPGGLGKDPERAERRAAALAAIDPGWNPGTLGWTVDWQRHYTYLTQLLADGARLTAIVPSVTRHGEDVGRWLATQRRNWDRLNEEQQHRLGALGVKKAPRARRAPAKTAAASRPAAGGPALQKGLQALTQYTGRTGSVTVPRSHVETVDIDGQEHAVRLGIWLSNTKSRRDKLSRGQLAQLAELGLEWAGPGSAPILAEPTAPASPAPPPPVVSYGTDFGQTAGGNVVDPNDWGSKYPRQVTPRRWATGTVIGQFAAAHDIVTIRTAEGEDLTIRANPY